MGRHVTLAIIAAPPGPCQQKAADASQRQKPTKVH